MSKTATDVFEVGSLYSNETIYKSLSVGNAGGIRPCVEENGTLRRLVIMTTAPEAKITAENPYSDRLEGDVFVYTAAGREGRQSLSGVNMRIPGQAQEIFPIFGFRNTASRRNKLAGQNRWEFLGLFQYQRHFPEVQVDSTGTTRDAWVFELRRAASVSKVSVRSDRDTFAAATEVLRADLSFDDSPVSQESSFASDVATSTALEILRRKMLGMHPAAFEGLVKSTLEKSGFEQVRVTRYTQDGGIDVEGRLGEGIWPLRGILLQAQAKRWIHTVGRREVAELRGSLHGQARGVVITTSHFSKSAVKEASSVNKSAIVLVSGYEFASIVKRLRVLD